MLGCKNQLFMTLTSSKHPRQIEFKKSRTTNENRNKSTALGHSWMARNADDLLVCREREAVRRFKMQPYVWEYNVSIVFEACSSISSSQLTNIGRTHRTIEINHLRMWELFQNSSLNACMCSQLNANFNTEIVHQKRTVWIFYYSIWTKGNSNSACVA